ncbi:MAG: hypothetical protein ACETWC_01480 [Acidobacteriota bacterium]
MNVAINLYVVTRIHLKDDSSITIRSVEQKLEAIAPDLPSLLPPLRLELIIEALRFFRYPQGIGGERGQLKRP